jgi:2-oxoglutarate dehydrogenase E2 component (dihydrolipoamide succinyltransferase)
MAIDIKAPIFPESVADGTVATWHKKVGDKVTRDEVIVDIETDKVVLEVVAPADGFLSQIIKGEGDTVLSQETLAIFETGTATLAATTASASAAPVAAVVSSSQAATSANTDLAPSVRKAVAENQLDASQITGSGRGGRITKEDVATHLSAPAPVAAPAAAAQPVSLEFGGG